MTKLQSPATNQTVITAGRASQSSVSEEATILAGRSSQSSVSEGARILAGRSLLSPASQEFSITGVLLLTINSLIEQSNNKLVNVNYYLNDFNQNSVSLDFAELSTDGSSWNTATIESSHPDNDSFPITPPEGGANYTLIWDANTDLGNGTFNNIYFRIQVSEGDRTASDQILEPTVVLEYGLGYFPPEPINFKKTNVSIDPSELVDLGWVPVTNSDVRKNIAFSNTKNNVTLEAGQNVSYISAHNRTVIGYSIFKSSTESFTPPGQGSEIANDLNTNQGDSSFSDTNVNQDETNYYKISTITDDQL